MTESNLTKKTERQDSAPGMPSFFGMRYRQTDKQKQFEIRSERFMKWLAGVAGSTWHCGPFHF